MEKHAADSSAVVLDIRFARSCVDYLRSRRIHRQFVGYLCICEASSVAGRQNNLKPAFREFFERFMVVGEPPQGTPYLVPFNEGGSLEASAWLNANIAGSYAPSSIRPQAPLRRVVDIFGAGRNATYALRDGHEELCLEHLLFGERLDPVALAGFLFRDHLFTLHDGESLDASHLVAGLYSILGFTGDRPDRIAIFDDNESAVAKAFAYSTYGGKA
jgi:hypothetical protein